MVFVNALTGSIDNWQGVVDPALREAGLGVLRYNLRGQEKSPVNDDRILDDQLIISDLCRLIDVVKPPRPIYCGLSIGGLFAARAVLSGRPAEGLGDAVAAGLLAYGSSPRTHLPGANPSGMLGIGYPLTVAGAAAD